MSSLATYSFVTLRTEDGRIEDFVDKDGSHYRIECDHTHEDGSPRCPTELCGALCCSVFPLIGSAGQACPHLEDDLNCHFQKYGGKAAKPFHCLIWPRRQADVDLLNERYADGERRCYLRVVKVK